MDLEHKEWLELRHEQQKRGAEEINELRLQAREKCLQNVEVNRKMLLRSIKNRKRKATITSLLDSQGNQMCDPNIMAKMMVDHLSQIIGQVDFPSSSVMEARDKLFKATKPLC